MCAESSFRPGRRGLPLLACLTLLWLSAAVAAPAAAQAPSAAGVASAQWSGAFQEAESALSAGRFKRAERKVDDLLPQLRERLPAGDDANAVLAHALLLQAVAAAGRGDEASAVWSWSAAQSLDPALRDGPLPAFAAEVASLLEEHRLRRGGEVPGALPAVPEGGDRARFRPPIPARAPEPEGWSWRGYVRIEILVGADGRVSGPVVEDAGTARPGGILSQLELLRGWRFQPATYDGEPVAVPLTVRDLQAPDSLLYGWVRDDGVRPIHDLLLRSDCARAHEAAAERVDDGMAADRDDVVALTGALAFRALAEACLGRRDEAWVSLRTAESLGVGAYPELPAYGEAGEWLWRQRGRCVVESPVLWSDGATGEAEEPAGDASRSPRVTAGCDAADPLVENSVKPPRPVSTPPLAAPDLDDQLLAVRLLINAEGRVVEARMLAGTDARAAPPALAAVRDWRFEPATKDGRAVAAVYDTSVPLRAEAAPTAAAADPVEGWQRSLERLEDRSGDGDAAALRADATALQEDLEAGLTRGGADLLARALRARALAEAALATGGGSGGAGGGEDLLSAAAWHWQAALSLAPEMRYADLAPYGVAGQVLEASSPAPDPEPEPGGEPSLDEPAVVSGRLPTAGRLASRQVSLAEVEVGVDGAGRPSSPTWRAGATPAQVSAFLEALRGWRFATPAGQKLERRRVVVRLGPPGDLGDSLSPHVVDLVRRAVFTADRDPTVAACQWRSAQLLEPRVLEVPWAVLVSSLEAQDFLRRNLEPPIVRWRFYRDEEIRRRGGRSGVPESPVKTFTPAPQYTQEARKNDVEGVVIVQGVIREDGRLRQLRILKGLPHGLNESALATLCSWRFTPARMDGEPIEVFYNLTVHFTLH